jgi:antitoxin CptB
MSDLLDPRSVDRLRYSSRRGLLENDLFIEKFFARHGTALELHHAQGFNALMDLSDPDLLDLLLRRKEPEGDLDNVQVREVLEMIRAPAFAQTDSQHP